MIEQHPITDRLEWLDRRKLDLTASDVGAVAGVDPYRTPLSVFVDKMGMGITEETPIMRRGRWLESAAADAIVECHPHWRVINPKVYLRDPEIRLGCTPDRLAEDEDVPGVVNLQIKAVSKPTFEKWNGEVPLNYVLQTLTEGMLVNARTSYLCAFVISTYACELVKFEIPRHPGAEIKIRQTAVDFWHDMEAGVMPVPDYTRDADVIAALYAQPKPGAEVDLSTSNRIGEILQERAVLKARIKDDTEAVSAIDTEIKATIGDAETATLPGWRLSWKLQTRKGYTVPESTTRVLRVTEESDDDA